MPINRKEESCWYDGFSVIKYFAGPKFSDLILLNNQMSECFQHDEFLRFQVTQS